MAMFSCLKQCNKLVKIITSTESFALDIVLMSKIRKQPDEVVSGQCQELDP